MLGGECCRNPPHLSSHPGSGHVKKLGGLDSYLSGTPRSKLAILLVSDIYGFKAPNLRHLADKLSKSGFYVVVPDFFHGDPYPTQDPHESVQEWLKRHDPVEASEEAKSVVKALERRSISKTAVVGFCWGGKVTVELAKQDGLIQAAVLCHPAAVTVNDIRDVQVPIEILGGELDNVSPPALLRQFEMILNEKHQIDSFVKIFPNVSHGWALRYNSEDPVAVKAAEEAHQYILNWVAKHLKPHASDSD